MHFKVCFRCACLYIYSCTYKNNLKAGEKYPGTWRNCVTENNCRYVQIKPTSCVMPQCFFAFQEIQQCCKPKFFLSSALPLELQFLASQSSLHVYLKWLFGVKHCHIGSVVHRSSANTALVHLSCSITALIPGKGGISVARELQQSPTPSAWPIQGWTKAKVCCQGHCPNGS